MKFLNNHPFNFKIVAGNDTVRYHIFKLVSPWPYNIMIDKEGKIMAMQLGAKNEDTFACFAKKLLKFFLKYFV